MRTGSRYRPHMPQSFCHSAIRTGRLFQALLAHDLSARSEIALIRGARLAQERDGHLTIVHVVDSDPPAPVIEAQQRHAREYLELDVRRLLGRDKPALGIELVTGDPAECIAGEAPITSRRSCGGGAASAARDRRRVRWHTVERLMRQSRRRVLVVNDPDQSPYRNGHTGILGCVDGRDPFCRGFSYRGADSPASRVQRTAPRLCSRALAPASITFSSAVWRTPF